MPVKAIQQQRQLTELGRIRCGDSKPGKNGGKQPQKLERFRFTSQFKPLIAEIAATYGGEVSKWGGEWQVYVTAEKIDVVMAPREIEQWMEHWDQKAKGEMVVPLRRCDGEHEQKSCGPCLCALEEQHVCKLTTRIWFLLPKINGLGAWRLETHGYYASTETAGTAEQLIRLAKDGLFVPGKLTLQKRQRPSPQGPRTFYVPVILVSASAGDVLSGRAALSAGYKGSGYEDALAEAQPAIAPSSQQELPQPKRVNPDTGEILESWFERHLSPNELREILTLCASLDIDCRELERQEESKGNEVFDMIALAAQKMANAKEGL